MERFYPPFPDSPERRDSENRRGIEELRRRNPPLIPTDKSRWALFAGSINAAASLAFQYVDMTEIVTNDSSLYALHLGSGANAGLHGPAVAEQGAYRITYTCDFGPATAGDKLSQYYSGDIGIRSHWFQGWDTVSYAGTTPTNHEQGRHTNFSEIRIVGGDLWVGAVTLPQLEIPYVVNNTAARTFTAFINCLIEKLSDTYSDNLSPGSSF